MLSQTEIMKCILLVVHDFLVKKIEFIYEILNLVDQLSKKLRSTIKMLIDVHIVAQTAIHLNFI